MYQRRKRFPLICVSQSQLQVPLGKKNSYIRYQKISGRHCRDWMSITWRSIIYGRRGGASQIYAFTECVPSAGQRRLGECWPLTLTVCARLYKTRKRTRRYLPSKKEEETHRSIWRYQQGQFIPPRSAWVRFGPRSVNGRVHIGSTRTRYGRLSVLRAAWLYE